MSKIKHILVDLDGVLADWSGGIERKLVHTPRALQWIDWSNWNGVKEGAPALVRELVLLAQASPGFYLSLKPIAGGADALRDMVADGHLVTICSTPDETNPTCADDKIAWLEENVGPGWGKRLILTHDKTQVRGDILIDDKENITGALAPEWEHVIFDAPYNQAPSARARLFHWNEWRSVVRFARVVIEYASGGYFCGNGPESSGYTGPGPGVIMAAIENGGHFPGDSDRGMTEGQRRLMQVAIDQAAKFKWMAAA